MHSSPPFGQSFFRKPTPDLFGNLHSSLLVAAILVVKPKEPLGGTKHRRVFWFAAFGVRKLNLCPGHKSLQTMNVSSRIAQSFAESIEFKDLE
jgi:hypothetical protein